MEADQSHTKKKSSQEKKWMDILTFIQGEGLAPTREELSSTLLLCDFVENSLDEITSLQSSKDYVFKFLWFDNPKIDIKDLHKDFPTQLGCSSDFLIARDFLANFIRKNENPHTPCLCIYVEDTCGKCVGIIDFQYIWSYDTLVIHHLYVLSVYQRKGLGKKLVSCVKHFYENIHTKFKDVAKHTLPTTIQLLSEHNSVEFWKKQDFTSCPGAHPNKEYTFMLLEYK